jgi:hypothetical protein
MHAGPSLSVGKPGGYRLPEVVFMICMTGSGRHRRWSAAYNDHRADALDIEITDEEI